MPFIAIAGTLAALWTGNWLYLLFPCAIVFYMIFLYWLMKRSINVEKERVKVLYQGSIPRLAYHFERNSSQIVTYKNQEKALSISFQDITAILECEDMFILRFKGKLFIPILKGSFIVGDVIEFQNWLQSLNIKYKKFNY
ncbi:hypothetical protein [Streptococcus dentiloxodontae]